MAYSTSAPPRLVTQAVGTAGGSEWQYSSTDSFETVAAADYFSNGSDLGMVVGDIVRVIDTTNNVMTTTVVRAVTAGGAASLKGGLQALTASGAVTEGVDRLTLAHASVVIASTIADLKKWAGKMLVIQNTSASGTAAHTVTITTGTFNGTNKVATLDAPGERLTVLVDHTGNGTIIENTGSVGLSG